jgi:hypothetical protein
MQGPAIDRASVFEKTSRGREEIARRVARLDAACRQILIVIDGQRDIDAIAALFPHSAVMEAVHYLRQEGFIGLPPLQRASLPAPGAAMDGPPGAARSLMVSSARECIGLLAERLIARIEAARTLDELAVAAGHWHMAMRESKRGKTVADALLEQVRRLLGESLAEA